MNKERSDALNAAAVLEMKQELANPTTEAEAGSNFPPGHIDGRPSPTHYGERREYGRKGN
ncbi:MAG: hypothetical protein NUV53_00615 [Patescibacteria group bacterium]|nr:hypothetical protein [Patescibacteria group bacterium]